MLDWIWKTRGLAWIAGREYFVETEELGSLLRVFLRVEG